MSVLSHGSFEIRRYYQAAKCFAMDQRLRLDTPRWRVLEFSGNPQPEEEVERQRARILRTALVRRDRDFFSREFNHR